MAAARGSPFRGVVAVYADHKSSPLSSIGSLHGLEEEVAAARPAEGLVVLATCNRFEVYMHNPRPGAVERLASAIASWGARPRVAEGREAVVRLMRIASGLESVILGENEILGQVREAWLKYKKAGLTTSLLDRIFHAAILAGKRARSETGISRGPASYLTAAVQAASNALGGLDGRRVAVVGGGSSGEKLASILCSLYKPSKLLAVSRSPMRASRVASRCSVGEPVALAEAPARARGVDAVLVAVKGYRPGSLGWALSARIVVDISNPPVVPRSGNVLGMEDLQAMVRAGIEERRKWVPAVEEIIAEEAGKLEARLLEAKYRIGEIIAALDNWADELARAMSGRESEYKALRLYGKRLLHPLYMALRRAAAQGMSWEAFQEAITSGAGSVRGVPLGKAEKA